MADSGFDKVKRKQPKHYYPIRAEKVENGKAYASIMVSEQATMLEHLRYTRRQMEKDEKQLKEMQDYLLRKQMPRKWTPYNNQRGFDDE